MLSLTLFLVALSLFLFLTNRLRGGRQAMLLQLTFSPNLSLSLFSNNITGRLIEWIKTKAWQKEDLLLVLIAAVGCAGVVIPSPFAYILIPIEIFLLLIYRHYLLARFNFLYSQPIGGGPPPPTISTKFSYPRESLEGNSHRLVLGVPALKNLNDIKSIASMFPAGQKELTVNVESVTDFEEQPDMKIQIDAPAIEFSGSAEQVKTLSFAKPTFFSWVGLYAKSGLHSGTITVTLLSPKFTLGSESSSFEFRTNSMFGLTAKHVKMCIVLLGAALLIFGANNLRAWMSFLKLFL
jgi:hypothetical protein